MPNADPEAAAREYAALLLKLHHLDPRGENESPELDAICDQMDVPWRRLGSRERKRVKGLSQDLYALADGRQGVAMAPDEHASWAEQGKAALASDDPDANLEHLRHPFPQSLPVGLVPFLQGRCWELLGNLEVALVFMREAAKTLPAARRASLNYLLCLGKNEQALRLAGILLEDPAARPADAYLGACGLILLAKQMEGGEAARVLRRVAPALRAMIAGERKKPLMQREDPDLEVAAARALSFVLHALNDPDAAVAVCTETLRRYPNDAALLTTRGLINSDRSPAAAWDDLVQAIRAGVSSYVPHAALAYLAIRQRKYGDLWGLTNEALRFEDMPPGTRAVLFEWRGIAKAELGQPAAWSEEDFAQARTLDPASAPRIEQNREAAVALAAERSGKTPSRLRDWFVFSVAVSAQEFAGAVTAPQLDRDVRARAKQGDYTELMAVPGA
jgi:hypothetical protein